MYESELYGRKKLKITELGTPILLFGGFDGFDGFGGFGGFPGFPGTIIVVVIDANPLETNESIIFLLLNKIVWVFDGLDIKSIIKLFVFTFVVKLFASLKFYSTFDIKAGTTDKIIACCCVKVVIFLYCF